MDLERMHFIFNLLNKVNVNGYENLRLMALAMQTLEEVIVELQKPKEEKKV